MLNIAYRVSRVAAMTALVAMPVLANAQSLTDTAKNIPAHFMFPMSKWASVSGVPGLQTFENKKVSNVGYRVITFGSSTSARTKSAEKLAQLGLVQDGDVLLSFRPEWVGTAAYANIQMGVSHTAIAYIRNGMVHTVESPMNYSSNLNSDHHYTSPEMPLRAMHIFRPKLSSQERKNMAKWLDLLLKNGPSKIAFDKDYNAPEYATGHGGNVNAMIANIGKIALGGGNATTMYCSELVYAALGLRNCDPSNFSSSCVNPLFKPLPLVGVQGQGGAGLTDGPNFVLKQAGIGAADRRDYIKTNVLVSTMNVNNMSSGHKAVMQNFLPLVPQLSMFYDNNEAPQVAMSLNQGAKAQMGLQDNYSPTSFIVKSVDDDNALEYVATVIYQ